jgi:ketosteroid isomerase-like protein
MTITPEIVIPSGPAPSFAAAIPANDEPSPVPETSHASAILAMFAALDAGDFTSMAGFLADDVVVQFGNADPVQGKKAFAELFAQVIGALNSVRHEVHDIWQAVQPEELHVAALIVHYTLPDDSVVSIPCCNVFRVRNKLIADYRVYLDFSPVLAALVPHE